VKKISFLTTHFWPENTAATNRVVTYVKKLEKRYKVKIFALGEKGQKREPFFKYSENIDVYYINQEDVDPKNFIKRALHEIKYINKLVTLSKSYKKDLTIATTPYMFMLPIVAFFISGKKIIDIRDIVWEYLNEDSFFYKTIKSILRKIMLLSLKKYNFIIVSNENEKKWLRSYNIIDNVCVISNGIEEEKFNVLSTEFTTQEAGSPHPSPPQPDPFKSC